MYFPCRSGSIVVICGMCLTGAGCTEVEQGRDGPSASQPPVTESNSEASRSDRLQGSWLITRAVINGEPFPKESQEDAHVGGSYKFESGRLTKHPNPDFDRFQLPSTHYRYRATATAEPKKLDLVPEQEASREVAWPTEKLIYELEGDRLVLCWSLVDPQRPQDFDTRPGDNKGLYILERRDH